MNRWIKRACIVFVALIGAIAISAYALLRASLPLVEGKLESPYIDAPVTIARDQQGVPVVEGQRRTDVAFALGFLHGQERFFQMDLSRRNAAGELSELFGVRALDHDKRQRKHRFRQVASVAVALIPTEHRALLESYTQGVNQGLNQLTVRPFEYLLLNQHPHPWQIEDSFLVVYSMYFALNDAEAKLDSTKGYIAKVASKDVVNFLSPLYTRWDAPLEPEAQTTLKQQTNVDPLLNRDKPPIPIADQINLRDKAADFYEALTGDLAEEGAIGSNNWAVSSQLTGHNSALVETDMHLGLRVPTTWYRAQVRYPAAQPVKDKEKQELIAITGVTLPGAPVIVAGSNGHIAWGFTNSYGDWADLIQLELDENGHYLSSDGKRKVIRRSETIKVNDQADVEVEYLDTHWGPIFTSPYDGSLFALRWLAHNPEATNLNLVELETAKNVTEAISIANGSGLPPQNFVCGDNQGNIGWSIAGKLPTRLPVDTTIPLHWKLADKHWSGWLSGSEYPELINPDNNRIWTANARVASGQELKKIGNGGYAPGPRQLQIKQRLDLLEFADEKAMLDIALDNRALYLSDYRQLILDSLDDNALAGESSRRVWLDKVQSWSDRASVDDVGYRLVREFHDAFNRKTLQSIGRYLSHMAKERVLIPEGAQTSDTEKTVTDSWPQWLNHEQEMLLRLYQEQPINWLNPKYDSWQALFLSTIDEVTESLINENGSLEQATWGERNTANIRHPLSGAIPLLGKYLNMAAIPLPGDNYMPNAQRPRAGVSQRIIVSPGYESQGIFHMPGGQSGHPLSPFYKSGYMDWAVGKATPFLPSDAKYKLVLKPKK